MSDAAFPGQVPEYTTTIKSRSYAGLVLKSFGRGAERGNFLPRWQTQARHRDIEKVCRCIPGVEGGQSFTAGDTRKCRRRSIPVFTVCLADERDLTRASTTSVKDARAAFGKTSFGIGSTKMR